MELVNALFAGMVFLLALLVFPFLVTRLNTLAINVIERTCQIG